MASRPSTDPFVDPGRLTTSEEPIEPALALDSAAIGVDWRPLDIIKWVNPGASRSNTSAVASGVTSRGPKPVPPVVSTKRATAEAA